MNVDTVFFEVVRKRLLNIQNHRIDAGLLGQEVIEDLIDIRRILDGAIKIRCQPIDAVTHRNLAHADHAFVVPINIVSAQLYFQATEPVPLDPVSQRDGVGVVGLGPR